MINPQHELEDELSDFEPEGASLTDEMPPMPMDVPPAPEAAAPSSPGVDTVAPVPRIAIRAFCESPATGVLLERAADDRRMARATVVTELGGVRAALGRFTTEPTPSLIILESGSDGQALLDDLDKLAEVCDAGTKLVVIGAVNDIGLYRELINRGVSDYLILPQTPLDIIDAISRLYNDPHAAPVGRTYAFMAARGGAGSSTVCHNLAWCTAQKVGEATTVIDFDLAFGTASLDFNQDSTHGLADALTQPERVDPVMLDRLLVDCTPNLSLLAAPSAIDRDYDLSPEAFEHIVDVVRQSVPHVFLDLPHAWTEWTQRVLTGADEIVLTATPDLASLRNAKQLFDVLTKARPNDAPPKLVLNQTGVAKRPEIPPKDFAEAVGGELVAEVPFDAHAFGTAANNGQMIPEVGGNTKASPPLVSLAYTLSGASESKEKSGGNPFQGLFKALKRG